MSYTGIFQGQFDLLKGERRQNPARANGNRKNICIFKDLNICVTGRKRNYEKTSVYISEVIPPPTYFGPED
jgi:hypothetical protein